MERCLPVALWLGREQTSSPALKYVLLKVSPGPLTADCEATAVPSLPLRRAGERLDYSLQDRRKTAFGQLSPSTPSSRISIDMHELHCGDRSHPLDFERAKITLRTGVTHIANALNLPTHLVSVIVFGTSGR